MVVVAVAKVYIRVIILNADFPIDGARDN